MDRPFRLIHGARIALILTTLLGLLAMPPVASAAAKPNIIYFLTDNLGFGELGCYGGGLLRGTQTPRRDRLASEGLMLLNFALESQCPPSCSPLMTGRYAIRSGNNSVTWGETPGGLVAWEKTLSDVLAAAGYDCYIVGKWHIGETAGRLPTDHGFLSWYGVPRSYGESLWSQDPYYDPKERLAAEPSSGWVAPHLMKIIEEFTASLKREPLIPTGAPLDYVPKPQK